jgi:hypothetical protein
MRRVLPLQRSIAGVLGVAHPGTASADVESKCADAHVEHTGNALPPIGPQDRNRQIVEEGYQLMSAPFSQVEHGSGFNAPGGDAPMPLVNRLRRAVGASIGSEVVKLLLNRLPVEAIA